MGAALLVSCPGSGVPGGAGAQRQPLTSPSSLLDDDVERLVHCVLLPRIERIMAGSSAAGKSRTATFYLLTVSPASARKRRPRRRVPRRSFTSPSVTWRLSTRPTLSPLTTGAYVGYMQS